MRSVAVLGSIVVAVWITAILTLFTIDAVIATLEPSWLRSLFGVAVFAAWVAAWYAALCYIFRRVVIALSKQRRAT